MNFKPNNSIHIYNLCYIYNIMYYCMYIGFGPEINLFIFVEKNMRVWQLLQLIYYLL